MLDLTKDIKLNEDYDLTFQITNEEENVKQHIITRLLVEVGELPLSPNFGSNLLKVSDREEFIKEVILTLSKEPRILELGNYKVWFEGKKLVIEFEESIGRVEINF